MTKRLIVCADGTWMRADRPGPWTNVARIASLVVPSADLPQLTYYDAGVGSESEWLDRALGGATGLGIGAKIRECYLFLCENWEPGDEIYLFGFSRGAFTVRSLVGLIRKCGLVDKRHLAHDRIAQAYEIYRRDDGVDSPAALEFRERFSRPVDGIHFVGVWDTVGALGIPVTWLSWLTAERYRFHDTSLSRIVKHGYHAVSIDERRGAFQPTLWTNPPSQDQVVEQAWFPGVHADVGGGYDDEALANVTFRWMAERAMKAGLALDDRHYRDGSFTPRVEGELHDSLGILWRLLPHSWRTIETEPYRGVTVSDDAMKRRSEVPSYRPPNLEAFLAHAAPATRKRTRTKRRW